MKYEITSDKENVDVKLGSRYNVTFPKTTPFDEVVLIVDQLIEASVGVSAVKIVNDIIGEMQKDG